MAVALLLSVPVETAIAVIKVFPRVEGRHMHVATMFGDVPLVNTFLHPGITIFRALKVTLAATLILAERVTG